ncbi:Uncharacterised protein [Actinobacillus pleuropneumoniae]|nr:Uncharacterised protein [Actinobacillus pleuropneumoniae]
MSAYDMQIGKLISGQRDLEGSGIYMLCAPDKTISEVVPFEELDQSVEPSLSRENPARAAHTASGKPTKKRTSS